ncbi:hypothetical protein TCAL_00368 [Tigriopus californicus]|uniref:RING-type E3 ubiquitin transferase n=3 Tax=Tigriopus californicus TaxID=6832 RepID=A0A553NBV1_TIGCA|nr:hypothetical protein TCAL_00368 [Tigriopus californicus]|eukprot:TCALIF_00368-PA protein Name:"Similar to KCMF1 E3 ubiquitin-protein ligase KCMF1 (Homo sapiens)" AED:0.01 eAED:0.01 QI:702/1/1/1/1/1/2/842/467
MSRHEGVSCDSCLKGNFRGRRYKCLVCYDYDLCASCYENGVTTTRHANTHPMQCILTRADHELFYGGEAPALGGGGGGVNGGVGTTTSAAHHAHVLDAPQSYTCPFCAKLGFTEKALGEHVASQHADVSQEVVCPICASLPGGDPNHVTDNFSDHLSLEHRSGSAGSRDLISFLDSPVGGGLGRGNMTRQGGIRRVPHNSRGVGRSRRAANVHNPMPPSSAFSTLSPSAVSLAAGRDPVDPIAELLSQLSGVRRTATSSSSGGAGSNVTSSSSQLQHMQMQLERQQAQAQRQEQRAAASTSTTAPRTRSAYSANLGSHPPISSSSSTAAAAASMLGIQQLSSDWPNSIGSHSQRQALDGGQFLLRQHSDDELEDPMEEAEAANLEASMSARQNRSQFVQDLVLSTLMMRRAQLKDTKVEQSQKHPEQHPAAPQLSKSSLTLASAGESKEQKAHDQSRRGKRVKNAHS